jgi:hypothetical protein
VCLARSDDLSGITGRCPEFGHERCFDKIPSDRPKAPLGAPPAPTAVRAILQNGGAVRLKWKGTRKGGTLFLIQRALVGPDGQRGIHYRIIAQRSGGRSGPSNLATLSFGTEMTSSQTRLAA